MSESHCGVAMTGSEIARELGISRQGVSQALKRAMGKMYNNMLKHKITSNPTETVLAMQEWLGITNEDDIKDFFNLFPKAVQDEIKDHAKGYNFEITDRSEHTLML